MQVWIAQHQLERVLVAQMQVHGDPPSEIVDEMTGGGGLPSGLMGGLGQDDEGIHPDFQDLPKELQEKCALQ